MAVRPNGKQVHRGGDQESLFTALRNDRKEKRRLRQENEQRRREQREFEQRVQDLSSSVNTNLAKVKVVQIKEPNALNLTGKAADDQEIRIRAHILAVKASGGELSHHFDESKGLHTFAVVQKPKSAAPAGWDKIA